MTCVQADQQGHPLQRNRLYSEWQELPSSHLPIQSSAEHSLVGQKTVRPKHLFERRLFVFWGRTIDARPCQWLRGRDRDWHHGFSSRLSFVTRGVFEARRDVVGFNYGEGAESPLVNIAHGIRGEMAQPPQNWRGVFLRRTAWCPSCPPPLSISASRDIFRQAAAKSRRNFCRNGCCGGNGGQQSLFNQGKGKLGEQ